MGLFDLHSTIKKTNIKHNILYIYHSQMANLILCGLGIWYVYIYEFTTQPLYDKYSFCSGDLNYRHYLELAAYPIQTLWMVLPIK